MRADRVRLLAALLVSLGVHAGVIGGLALLASRPGDDGQASRSGAVSASGDVLSLTVRLGAAAPAPSVPAEAGRAPATPTETVAPDAAANPDEGDTSEAAATPGPEAATPSAATPEGSTPGAAATPAATGAGAVSPGHTQSTDPKPAPSRAGGARVAGDARRYEPPRLTATLSPHYPRSARRDGAEGVARVRVEIDSTGVVEAVDLHRSSGHGALDRAAVRAARRAEYAPARLGRQPTGGSIIVAVVFRLE
jgi:protein TonB